MIALLHVPVGWVCVAAADKGIARSTLPRPTPGEVLARIDVSLARPARGDRLLPRVAEELRRYFAGEAVALDYPLDLTGLPEFTRRVLLAVSKIPYGTTRSYGWVARRVGRPQAARAVGQVMARSPLPPLVPCHRVVGGDGSLVGFGSGLRYKRQLLEMEGAAAALPER